jgi:uncharacterized protein (TIGR03067 family)
MKSRMALGLAFVLVLGIAFFYLTAQKVEGEWELFEMVGSFKLLDPPHEKGTDVSLIVTFTDGEFTIQEAGPEGDTRFPKMRASGTYSCDNTKNPKQITFNFGDRTAVAIYGFSFGTLRICVGEDEKIPPSEFHTGPSPGRPATVFFERVNRKWR